ncbi:MAG: hypothetical protein WAQ08_05795 [Aquabacterium sp.]|uniref:hypothetical protein n=1 Tax=Aquabacterium sp. TaxID=1872578 RepID=UPI003BB190AE
MNSEATARKGERVEDGPGAHVSPGPSRLADPVRAKLLRALDEGIRAVAVERRSAVYQHGWGLRGALAVMSGYLESDEPEIAEKLWQILKEATE